MKKYFKTFPTATIAVEVKPDLQLATLKRCLAYGGHDAYLAFEPTNRFGGEVELPVVLFTTMVALDQFMIAFDDLIVALDFDADRAPVEQHNKLTLLRNHFAEVEQ